MWRRLDNRRGAADAVGSLGEVSLELGEVHRAVECFQASLTIFREIGDRCGEWRMLW